MCVCVVCVCVCVCVYTLFIDVLFSQFNIMLVIQNSVLHAFHVS